MKNVAFLFLLSSLLFCTPKGPQTFDSPFIGKTKKELITAKGIAKEIKIYGKNEAYIYKTKEEYFGKNVKINTLDSLTPKKVYIIESIYYINENQIVYKYQVWKKRLAKP